jgi:hypothetical protein
MAAIVAVATGILALSTSLRLDVVEQGSIFGKRAVLLTSALPFKQRAVLELADAALSGGASVTLLTPLPRSGAAAEDEAALRLLLRIQRQGFPKLMEALGFSWGVGLYGTGNRQRIAVQQVRSDDVETLALALNDADLLLLHAPVVSLEGDAALSAARFTMQRAAFGYVLRQLRQRGQTLHRDSRADGLHWAWLVEEDRGETRPAPSEPS